MTGPDRPFSPPPIIIVSGATGASARAVLDRALSQFPEVEVPVVVIGQVQDLARLEQIVNEAAGQRGTIVHTLVNGELRRAMLRLCRQRNVVAIDLIGRLLDRLSEVTGQAPLEQPGLYHRLHLEDFRRSEAINFAVAHDDGRRVHELDQADIVLLGVSRVSKTPLSIYLSVQGWKVANLPLVPNLEPPQVLFELPPGRVIGLTIDPNRLQDLRQGRLGRLGLPERSDYASLQRLHEEIEWARLIYRRGRFPVVDITGRSIEETAQTIIELVGRRAEGN